MTDVLVVFFSLSNQLLEQYLRAAQLLLPSTSFPIRIIQCRKLDGTSLNAAEANHQ
jgi:hypothetical protein